MPKRKFKIIRQKKKLNMVRNVNVIPFAQLQVASIGLTCLMYRWREEKQGMSDKSRSRIRDQGARRRSKSTLKEDRSRNRRLSGDVIWSCRKDGKRQPSVQFV